MTATDPMTDLQAPREVTIGAEARIVDVDDDGKEGVDTSALERAEARRARRRKRKNIRRKRIKKRGSIHFGDDYSEDEEIGEASWGEVFHSCFHHSREEWLQIAIGFPLALAYLYFFGLGLDFLGNGAKVMSGCFAGTLFSETLNPLTAVMIGILVTVLLQSSSVTSNIVIGLVATDDSLLTVQQGIYMIMGANIGTTVTNTLVSLGHFQNSDQLGLAFAGATVHDMFNIFTVLILLPLEVASGYLFRLTTALVRGANTEPGEAWQGPAKKLISPLGERILIANKEVTNSVAVGGSCDDFYPIICSDPSYPTRNACSQVGLIACSKKTGTCPAFFDPNATQVEDEFSGFVVFCMGLVLIFCSIYALVRVLTRLLTGVSLRVIRKSTDLNGYLLIGIGCGLTVLTESSSITTSFMTPIVGMGALRLEQMYPLTIGANLGTTVSALLTALVTDGNEGLQVALAHLMFNVTGMMIWYMFPGMRYIPLECARRLGQYASVWRSFTLFYIAGVFVLLPTMFMGLSAMFIADKPGFTIGASILVTLLAIFVFTTISWCYFHGGQTRFYSMLARANATHQAKQTLPTDMDRVKNQIRQHQKLARLRFTFDDYSEIDDLEYKPSRRQLQRAVNRLPRDMNYIKTAIDMLYLHTGLPNIFEQVTEIRNTREGTEDDTNTRIRFGANSIHVEEISGRTENPPQTLSRTNISLLQFGIEFPLSYKISIVVVLGLMVWSLVELYTLGGKAAIGAAALVSIMLGYALLGFIHLWFSAEGRQRVIEYVRNYRERDRYIKRLPLDMTQVKVGLEDLLSYHGLVLEQEKLPDYYSVSLETSSFMEISTNGREVAV